MDLKVYKKEEVSQPSGIENIYVPDIIDIYPDFTDDVLVNASIVEEQDELEQAGALATIWQKGLDPLDEDNGIRWSEVMLGEVSVLEIMEDITITLSELSTAIQVEFDTVLDSEGKSYLSYKIKVVA